MEKSLVSVVLCTYNGEKYLDQQIRSILEQTWQPLELIISDDASTDGTVSLLKNYESIPGVMIYYNQSNVGLSANYSFAASKARGKFIAFSDQDDIWKKEKIEKLVAAIGNYPLVYSDSILTNESGEPTNQKLSDLKRMYCGDDSRGYFLYSCVWGHGMLVTRELLDKSLPVPPTVHHDIWITFQAFLNGGIKYLDEPLTWYRRYGPDETRPHLNEMTKKEALYFAYKEKLAWLELMQQYERPLYQPFYQRLLALYRRKEKGYVWPLVFFMLKYRKAIFSLSKKGFMSQLVEILKQGRGEGRFQRNMKRRTL